MPASRSAARIAVAAGAPVVVAEDGDAAERRADPPERRRHVGRAQRLRERRVVVDVVAEQRDEVRALAVDERRDALDLLEAHVRRARVEVGDEREAEAVVGRAASGRAAARSAARARAAAR